MCLRSVNIDEVRLRRISPTFQDVNVIDRWLAAVIDSAMSEMEQAHVYSEPVATDVYNAIEQRVKYSSAGNADFVKPIAIDVESMRGRLHRMVHEVYSMP